jgi:RecB family endonuclease NucS
VKNLSSIQIAGQSLQLYRDENGRGGREYPTTIGLIDILAVDYDGNFVILELKVGQGPDRALGQVLRYMGWVKQELAGDKNVSGIIVANTVDQRLIYAATVTPNIKLFEYNISFTLDEVTLS